MAKTPCKHQHYEKLDIIDITQIQMCGKDMPLEIQKRVCLCLDCRVLFMPRKEEKVCAKAEKD